MKCTILSTCVVVTKDYKHQHYVIDDSISFEELNTYFTNKYGENLDSVVFGQNFGYLHK